MTKRLVVLAVTAAALSAPAGAGAGGWATVGLDPLPDGVAPGEPWSVDLTILQHGVTPLEGVEPRVIVRRAGGGERRAFPARATEEPGVYRATVVFASAGTWNYAVDDGFSATHTYPPVSIGKDAEKQTAAAGGSGGAPGGGAPGGGPPSDDGPDYLLALAAAAVAALAAALGAAALQRRGGSAPAGG
jgi:hypothetical protein